MLSVPDGHLVIDARALRAMDAVPLVLLRAAVERFAGRCETNSAWLKLPLDPAASARFCHLIGTSALPSRTELIGAETDPPRPSDVLLAGCRLRDHEHRAEASKALTRALGLGRGREVRRGRLAVEALNALATNGFHYAPNSDIDVIVAACRAPGAGDLQVVTFDAGKAVADHQSPPAALDDIVRRSRAYPGNLSVVESAAEQAFLRVLAGTGRLHWRQSARISETPHHVPGFLAIFEMPE